MGTGGAKHTQDHFASPGVSWNNEFMLLFIPAVPLASPTSCERALILAHGASSWPPVALQESRLRAAPCHGISALSMASMCLRAGWSQRRRPLHRRDVPFPLRSVSGRWRRCAMPLCGKTRGFGVLLGWSACPSLACVPDFCAGPPDDSAAELFDCPARRLPCDASRGAELPWISVSARNRPTPAREQLETGTSPSIRKWRHRPRPIAASCRWPQLSRRRSGSASRRTVAFTASRHALVAHDDTPSIVGLVG